MRSRCIIFFPFFCFFILSGQNDEDALRYSRGSLNGSARFMGLGGAMGALGADLSCLNNNPAGIGIYKKSDISISAGIRISRMQSTYNDSVVSDFKNGLALPQLGIAGAGVNREIDKNTFYRKNFAISLNRNLNFKNNITIAGPSRGSSMALAFSAAAQGKTPESLDQFYEYFPYYYDLIDTINGSSILYSPAIPEGANMKQEYNALESGGYSDLAFGGGYSWNDKLYGGWSLGFAFLSYTRSSIHMETSADSLYEAPNLGLPISQFSYSEELDVSSRGINLKLGFIYRFNQYIRAGFAYHSPTAISMKENYKSYFDINYHGLGTLSDTSQTGQIKYSLITPSKVQGSFSLLLQKAGSVNFEIERINYATMLMKASQNYFTDINKFIRQTYKRSLNVKIGMEWNVKPVILRAGYAMFGGPTGKIFSGAGVRHSFSGGAGLRKGNYYLDMVYSMNFSRANFYLYNPQYVNPARLKFSTGLLLLTVGSKI